MFFKGVATARHGGTKLLLPALGRERQEDLWGVLDQPGLNSEFQDNKRYIV